jgi:tetratricopeptide (TPR) repeat protein
VILVLLLSGNAARGVDAVTPAKKPPAQPDSGTVLDLSGFSVLATPPPATPAKPTSPTPGKSGSATPAKPSLATPGKASSAPAEVAKTPSPEIQRAIADLASADFTTRERASISLWNAGAAAEPALEKVVRESDDFEVVYRARQILQSFQVGIYPDTPAETVGLIIRFRTGSIRMKQTIARSLQTDGKADLLRRLIAKETPYNRDQLNQYLTSNSFRSDGPYYGRGRVRRAAVDPAALALSARQSIAQGEFDNAERILLRGVSNDFTARDYAALLLSRGKLDAAVAQLRVNLQNTDEVVQRQLAWMLRAKGDLAGAVAAAKLAKDVGFTQELQAEMADWKELAKVGAKTDVDALASSPDGSAELARILAFRHLAGEKQASDLASAAAVKVLKQGPGRDRRLLSALLLNDRADPVIDFSKTEEPRVAFGLLVARSQLKEAFGLVKIPVPIPAKTDWPAWLKDGKKEVSPDRLLLAHQMVRALHMAGEEEQVRALLAAIVTAFGERDADETRDYLALDLMELEVRFGRPESSEALAAKLLALELKEPDIVISALYREQDAIATMLWRVLRKQFPGEDRPAALKHLRRLLAARPDRAAIAQLVSLLPRFEPLLDAPAAEESADDEASNPRARKQLALATLLNRIGEGKLALKYLARVPATGVAAQTLIDQGNLYAEAKEWTEAIKAFKAAVAKDPKSASALYLLGWAQTKHGEETEGRKRMEQALMIPLGDGESRHDLVQTLVRLNQDEEAARQRMWLLRLAALHDRSIVQTLMETGDLAAEKGDDANMATVWQRVGVELISGSVFLSESRFYLQPPFSAHNSRARELLRAGKPAEAIEEVHKAESIEPANLQLAIDCDSDLRKHGAAGEADALYRRMLDQHEVFCRDFPKSGTFHNDLAWLAANLDRDLDKALAHAQRAVELEPESAGVLDTLAEVQFRRGDRAEAVRLAKRCVEMEPDGEHYKKQLARFEKKAETAQK